MQKSEESGLKKATFAGGCFWCMEPPFDALPGVVSVMPGYTGGTVPNPSYDQVSTGKTGHAEAVRIVYDPQRVTYRELLDVFWRNIDPTVRDRQFADRGSQYRTAIFYHDDEQRRQAQESKDELGRSGKFDMPIVTEIVPAGPFYPAEDYHRQYYKKYPQRYQFYKKGSGRADYLERTWGVEERQPH